MTFDCTAKFLIDALGKTRADEVYSGGLNWRKDGARIQVDSDDMEKADWKKLLAHAETANVSLYRKLTTWLTLRKDPEGDKVRTLQHLETALIGYIAKSPNKFVFMEQDDNEIVPYFVNEIEFHAAVRERDGAYRPPYTQMDVIAVYRNKLIEESIIWRLEDLVGEKMAVSKCMEKKGLFIETPESVAKWETELLRHNEVVNKIGHQFRANGKAYQERNKGSWWNASTATVEMVREGRASKVVIDDVGDKDGEEEEDNYRRKRRKRTDDEAATGIRVTYFWKNQGNKKLKGDEAVGDGDDDSVTFRLPVHPYVQVFNIEIDSQGFYEMHVNGLTEYKYDPAIEEKLVLNPRVKRIIAVLLEGAAQVMDDIVAGKSGGVFVLNTGFPGTGKTLTAQVYGERMERPLYEVQCAQLGTNEEELEKNLSVILARATRWGAILNIDEADVYVRARGDDVQQNAMVGVFLRILERYRGVVFMTSNRRDAIDDAIVSRAIAHIKFDLPARDELKKLWAVLSDNYNVFLSPGEYNMLVDEFPFISGRNVKTLLKLATAVARKEKYEKGEAIKLIRDVAEFVDFPPEHYAAIKSAKGGKVTPRLT